MKHIHTLSDLRYAITLCLWILLTLSGRAQTPEIALIPQPQECILKSAKRHSLRSVKTRDNMVQTHGSDEYTLRIRKGKAVMSGNLFWAKETLKQLQDEQGRVPDVEIHDWAAYPWRGFMHDTGRNYQPLDMLKQTIDLMARYKMNLFHWHLTDHPAWRIQCYCHPELNDAQYQRKGRDEGKYYTYDEIRELIRYAKERGISVMPEIDIPGHAAYFKTTYGFTMASEQGKRILEDCLQEFFAEIPSSLCPLMHIGSDEIHIADPEGFSQWIQSLVTAAGRTPIVWDPGLPVHSGTIRQGWNQTFVTNLPSLPKDSRYIDSFVGYLNYYDPMMFAMRAYQHPAAGQEEPDTTRAVGGILCLWNDVRVDKKENISLHNGMIQGMMTFAERFWQGGSGHPQRDENLYPDPQSPQGKALCEMESRMTQHRNRYYTPQTMRWASNASITWDITLDGQRIKAWGGSVDLDALCRVYSIEANKQKEAVAETVLTVERDTILRVWMGFDTPARSDRMSTGIGPQGQWENNGHCYLNGEEILPPVTWQQPGAYNYPHHTWSSAQEEQPYTDEQFYWMRPSVPLNLKAGRNEVRIIVPHTFPGQRWSFAFIPTDWE